MSKRRQTSKHSGSGWLKAISRVGLRLTIPGSEFVIGLHIWLGASLFPLSPICTCFTTLGVCTPFTLNLYSDRTIPRSGVPREIT